MTKPIFENKIRIGLDLPDDTELWRYMRLSTLLMLFRGKVFIPTIEELRQDDPVEAGYLCPRTEAYFEKLSETDECWLLGRATENERVIINNPRKNAQQKAKFFVTIWDRELARRRRIWCWHKGNIESMALWNIYAREGVAIKTTPAQIKRAFQPSVNTALIERVRYVDNASSGGKDNHFMRPYLFKQHCYKHEQEVRIILPRDPDELEEKSLLPINPKKLISEIRISPNLPRSEAAEVRRSIIKAWQHIGDQDEDKFGDISVFFSDAKSKFESAMEFLEHSQCELTGSANFGLEEMPFVICGDFCSNPHDYLQSNSGQNA